MGSAIRVEGSYSKIKAFQLWIKESWLLLGVWGIRVVAFWIWRRVPGVVLLVAAFNDIDVLYSKHVKSPLSRQTYRVYGDLVIIYPKPYSIYLRVTIKS